MKLFKATFVLATILLHCTLMVKAAGDGMVDDTLDILSTEVKRPDGPHFARLGFYPYIGKLAFSFLFIVTKAGKG